MERMSDPQEHRPLALTGLLELAGHALGVGFDETSPYEESFEVVFREGRYSAVAPIGSGGNRDQESGEQESHEQERRGG